MRFQHVTILLLFLVISLASGSGGHGGGHGSPQTTRRKEPRKSGVRSAKVQTICPITKKQVRLSFFADYNNNRIYLCSEKCKARFNKRPQRYINRLYKMRQPLEWISDEDIEAKHGEGEPHEAESDHDSIGHQDAQREGSHHDDKENH